MPLVEVDAQAAREELKRMLANPVFARQERLSRLLQFVVERCLEGRAQELKESVIATEIFGRRPDYNPKTDAIVRTEARRLRALLNEYYLGDGRGDALVIELPKGGYIPEFRQGTEAAAQEKRRSAPLFMALASLALAMTAAGWWLIRRPTAPIPIAVLPLIDLSQDSANEYFADGLTSEIIRNLSIIDGLAVRSQTSSFTFKGKPPNLREAGKQLGADYILEGSVLRAGQQLRINAQLVRVRDDFPVWSGRYDRELTDIFVIQDEIARGVVNGLRLKLGRGRRRYEVSAEAYDLYLRGRGLQVRIGLAGYDQSIRPLEEAIAKDPSFAPAYAALAIACTFRSGQFRFDIAEEVAKMRASAEKAIQLDPLLAEAHYARAMAYARDADWVQSEKSFRHAIGLNPSNPMVYSHMAFFLLFPLGRVDEALDQLRLAEKIDRLSPTVHYESAFVLSAAGRYKEAEAHCDKLPAEWGPKSGCLGSAKLGQGRIGEVIQLVEPEWNRLGRGDTLRALLGCAYARAGRRDDAEKLAADLTSLGQANIFACIGDKDRTFEALERRAATGPIRIGWILNDQRFALLRGDPRLKALRRKVGLPE
jgi:TolB-like protein